MVTYLSIVDVTSVSDEIGSVPLSYLRKGMAAAKEARLKIVAIGKIIVLEVN